MQPLHTCIYKIIAWENKDMHPWEFSSHKYILNTYVHIFTCINLRICTYLRYIYIQYYYTNKFMSVVNLPQSPLFCAQWWLVMTHLRCSTSARVGKLAANKSRWENLSKAESRWLSVDKYLPAETMIVVYTVHNYTYAQYHNTSTKILHSVHTYSYIMYRKIYILVVNKLTNKYIHKISRHILYMNFCELW